MSPAYDHGGAGGGYENTWATGKLYFGSMKIKNIRIHNRPAYNSEVHGTRDMGVGELNNCYEDAELADTIMAVGRQLAGDRRPIISSTTGCPICGAPAPTRRAPSSARTSRWRRRRIIFVDPRRTPTIAACEVEAGKENVLHLAINPGTDLALFNALFTEIAAKGWVDRAFIAASTAASTMRSRRTRPRIEQAAQITGLKRRRHPQGGRMDRRSPSRAGRGGEPCSPTRRA